MTIQSIIKKGKIEIAVQNGVDALRVSGKLSSAEIEFIKANKPAIIEEVRRIEAEKKAAWDIRMAEANANAELKKTEYLRTADLRRCLVCYTDEWGYTKWYIETLTFDATENRMSQASFGLSGHISLEHITKSMESLTQWTPYGLGGSAAVITTEQEAQIIAEQEPATIVAEEKAAAEEAIRDTELTAKKAALDFERQAKFAEAQRTGKKVLLRSWPTECCDPDEECSTDIHYEYAMPDGSTVRTWTHTW